MRTIEESTPASTTSLASRRADLERYEAQVAEWTALIGQYRAGARRLGTPDRLALDHITDELQLRRNEASAQVLRLKNFIQNGSTLMIQTQLFKKLKSKRLSLNLTFR